MEKIKTTLFTLIFCSFYACQTTTEVPIKEQIVSNEITVPKGFHIEKLHTPSKHKQGSWVSITKNDKGQFYTSDQYGTIYKTSLLKRANKIDTVSVEKLDLNIGSAQGLLWHKGNLFALVNSGSKKIHSGLYKISDSNKDGHLNKVTQLRSFDGNGEHGPHNIVLSPDKKSLYLVFGNYTDIPKNIKSYAPKVWAEDNILPVIKDPSGHANTRKAPGGWVAKTDLEGKDWTLFNVGMRNTYDIAFNKDGELFGFDADMEYDLGMPWYRPIRLNHMTSGSDFGWRTGTGKFLPYYPDNLPSIADLGQGSPTGLLSANGLKFPTYYQDGLYLLDWSYGTMYYAKLTPKGSSYTAKVTEFLSGVPLPLTNGIVGNDGALYFLTGGRRLESNLYRLSYIGEKPSDIIPSKISQKGESDRTLRKKLEVLHAKKTPSKISFILDNLDHKDRYIRFSARVALEHQNPALWLNTIEEKITPVKTIVLSLAIAHIGDDAFKLKALNALLKIDWNTLNPQNKIGHIRAIQLLLARNKSELSPEIKTKIQQTFLPTYLSNSENIDKELAKLLSYLQTSEIIESTIYKMETDTSTAGMKALYLSNKVLERSEQYGKDIERMLKNMPNQQHISYAKSLSFINKGWTLELRKRYFQWFGDALQKSGGKMYAQFIKVIQKTALANVPESERDYFTSLSIKRAEGKINYMENVKQPKGPGNNWTVESLMSAYEKNHKKADFKNGENLFKASLCISCHSIQGMGGSSGPELSKIGTRFNVGDIGEAIVNPSGTIADRYRYTNYHMKNGSIISGIVINKTDKEIELSTSAFVPEAITKIKIANITKTTVSKNSPMPPALVNRLNEQELTDLIAYLISGGNEKNKVYEK